MDSLTVDFDHDDRVWIFTPVTDGDDERSRALDAGAPITLHLGGFSWTVRNLRCSTPLRIEVAADAGEWAKDAIRALLGDEAATLLDGDPVSEEVTIMAGATAAWQQAAMGMLAVAATEPGSMLLRAIDIAALAHRAGLDALGHEFPGAEQIVDDVMEALDCLPDVLIDALDSEDPPNPGVSWRIARQGVSDARSFIFSVTGGELSHLDIDAEFELLMEGIGHQVLASSHDVFGSVDLGTETSFESLESYIIDTRIRGVVNATATYDAETGTVTVGLKTRALGRQGKAERLYARVVGSGNTEVIGSTVLRSSTEPSGPQLSGKISLAQGTEPAYVEIVGDLQQPVTTLGAAQDFHDQYELFEAQRILRQLGTTVGDSRQSVIDWRETVAEYIKRGPLGNMHEGYEPDVFPLPSDALITILGALSTEILDSLNGIDAPAYRASAAHNIAILGLWTAIPWVNKLIGDVSMIEAEASSDLGAQPQFRSLEAAERAAAAYSMAGAREGFEAARRYVEQFGERRSGDER